MKKLFTIMLTAILLTLFPMTVYAEESPSLLKDLDVTNGFMIQFDKNTFTYTVELDEGETTADVVAVPYSDNCNVKIEGDGEKIPAGSSHTVTVSVNDSQGNFATYTLNVYAQADKGGLSFLRCLNGTMSPQYRETARNFYIILPNEYDSAELDIRTWDEKADVKIEGNENIEEGKRKRAIMTITDSDGVVSEYALYIYRQKPLESNINRSYTLSDIQINSGLVPIEFEQAKGYYEIEVPDSVSSLEISAIASNRENVVEISGSDVVTDDENTIVTITVSNPDDDTTDKSIYVLEFYRNSAVKTPKYTDYQLIVAIVSSIMLSFIVFSLIHMFVSNKKKKAKKTYENVEEKAQESDDE